MIMIVPNGNAVSIVISDKKCADKQTNKLDQSQDIVTGNAYVLS